MKLISLSLIFALSGFAASTQAQTVDVKGTDASAQEDGTTTTIEIKKGKTGTVGTTEKLWEIVEGTADVEGEASASTKDAKANWKKECNEWKKEIRADNKENKVMVVNCGQMSCGGDAGSKICTSKANYKIKTKMN